MKKIALVLAVLLIVGMAAFAEDSPVSVFASGFAKATIGYDLDAQNFGIVNQVRGDVGIMFNQADLETESSDDPYGYLKITNLGLLWYNRSEGDDYNATITSGGWWPANKSNWTDRPTWTGKVMFGDFYFQVDQTIFNGFTYGLRARRERIPSNLDDLTFGIANYTGTNLRYATTGEVAVGGSVADAVDFKAKLGTADGFGAGMTNDAAIAVDVEITAVDNLSVGGTFVTGIGTNWAGDMGFGGKASYDISLGGDMAVAPYVGFDGRMPTGGTMAYDFGAGLNLTWGGDSSKFNNEGMGFVAELQNLTDPFDATATINTESWYMFDQGLAVGFALADTNEVNVAASLYQSGALVENLDLVGLFEMKIDAAAVQSQAFGVEAYYSLGDITPGGYFFYFNDASSIIDINVAYTGIANTMFMIDYYNGVGATSGAVSFITKISM